MLTFILMQVVMHATEWVSIPKWAVELITSAKSFEHNALLGSRRLNQAGLHAARVRFAHRRAAAIRANMASQLSVEDRTAFDRDGLFVRHDFLPKPVFNALREQLRAFKGSVREKREGDTLMRKLSVDAKVQESVPALASLTTSPTWRALISYAGACDMDPAVYIQSLFRSAEPEAVDPQTLLHADTFHPHAKAWLFLTDVAEDEGAFMYVPGSHRLTESRLAWEAQMSLDAARSENRETREGSFRVSPEALRHMGWSGPVRLAVPANTLVVADTFGFHARGPSVRASTRVEVWGFGRRSPFVPWRVDQMLQKATRPSHRKDEWLVREGVSPFGAA